MNKTGWVERVVVLLLPAVLTLGSAVPAAAVLQDAGELALIRNATERFRDMRVAMAEGYIHDPMMMCVTAALVGARPELGAMGVHLFQPELLGIAMPPPPRQRLRGTDTTLDWTKPEVLVYEPQPDRSMRLVAVEYLVFEAAWKSAGKTAPPTFYGTPFVLVRDDPATAYDEAHMLEPHYELHLWLYRENPNGWLAEFNPGVSCEYHQPGAAAGATSVFQATLMERDQATVEVSTEQLQELLRNRNALVFDVRPYREYVAGHIPGALHLGPSGEPAGAAYVPDMRNAARILGADKAKEVVLYCDGPFCDASRLVGAQLRAAGYTNVKRYQLGIPVWRALGGVTAIEPDGIAYLLARDPGAVFVDARSPGEVAADPLPRAQNIPPDQVATAVARGPLASREHDRPIVVVGRDGDQARAVAILLARRAFFNVSYYPGPIDRVRGAFGR